MKIWNEETGLWVNVDDEWLFSDEEEEGR